MDWIRRNWPDLLIGVALVAVIAGIVITLLSGGSFSLFDRSGTRVATQPSSPPSSNNGSPFQNNTAVTPTAEPTVEPVAPAANSVTQDPTPSPDSTTAIAPAGSAIEPILPDLPVPEGTVQSTASADVSAATPATPPPVTSPSVTPQPEPVAAAVTPNTPIPVAAADRSAPYRVSVGAFGQRQNAEELADTFRAQGYPVFVAPENNLFITLVGPYTQEADAVQVANRIRTAGSDALVYRLPDPEPEAPVAAASPAPTPAPAPAVEPVATASTPAPAAPTETPIETPVATATPATNPDWVNRGVGTLLQVGAYGSLESSLPQRRRLESLGFTVSERFGDGLIRLVIGPFDERELSVVQAQLAVNGIDNFPVP